MKLEDEKGITDMRSNAATPRWRFFLQENIFVSVHLSVECNEINLIL